MCEQLLSKLSLLGPCNLFLVGQHFLATLLRVGDFYNAIRSCSRLYNATVCVTCGLVAMQWEITRWSASCCISKLCNITRSRSTCRPLAWNRVFSAPPFDQLLHIVLWYCGCCRGPVRPTPFSVMDSELFESIRSAVIGHPPLFVVSIGWPKGCHLRSRAYVRTVLDQRCETMHLNKKNILTCLCHSVCNISVYIYVCNYSMELRSAE